MGRVITGAPFGADHPPKWEYPEGLPKPPPGVKLRPGWVWVGDCALPYRPPPKKQPPAPWPPRWGTKASMEYEGIHWSYLGWKHPLLSLSVADKHKFLPPAVASGWVKQR